MMSKFAVTFLLLLAQVNAAAADLSVRVVNADGRALADAVVFVPTPATTEKPAAAKRAVIAQRNRVFDPFVTVVERGSMVDFPNEDTMLHHVYSFSPAKRFEIKLYKGTPPSPVAFETPGVVVLGCNLHDWMLAYVVVLDTRLHAKTGADGVGRIGGIPAGVHEVMVWYPGMREPLRVQQVALGAEESRQIEARLNTAARPRPRAPPVDPMRY